MSGCITAGSYVYIRGTNIEIGIQRVCAGGTLALVRFRNGKRAAARLKPHQRKARARLLVSQKIPIACLTHKSAFTKRGLLQKDFQPLLPLQSELPSPAVKKNKQKSLHVWGLKEIAYTVKSFDRKTGIVTFAVIPTRRAHVSVLRYTVTQPLVAPLQRRISLLGDPAPAEVLYFPGANFPMKIVIEDSEISLYKISQKTFQWIPNAMLSTLCACEGKLLEDEDALEPLGTLYLHGLVPLEVFREGENCFVKIDGIFRTVVASVLTVADPALEYLRTHRHEEAEDFVEDYLHRMLNPEKLLPVGVV